ncbi:unnamed protein product [Schistosoma margrebowiei]|uniref:Uncharacterized protein n=1 Tax=Schistosoma margrebowiei TaxID=48269 RepID=A0A183LDR1_9TREM|nr:unnamed protein product [Schistosoma margrebowiei]
MEELATTAGRAAREGNVKQLYDTTKKLAGKYSKSERPVKDKEGKPITEIQQQRNRWVEYFEEFLNRPAPTNPPDMEAAHTDLPIDVNPPTPVTNKEAKSAVEVQEWKNRWVEHFEELLNTSHPPSIEAKYTNLPTTPIIGKTIKVIRQINDGKATGPNTTTHETIKSDTEAIKKMLHNLVRKTSEE